MGTLATGDLTTLATAKAFLPNAPNDAVLSGMITRVSRGILNYIHRGSVVPANYVEKYNGQNTDQLVLYNWPLIALNELKIYNQVIPPANPPTVNGFPTTSPWGYRIAPTEINPPGSPAVVELVGGWNYWRGNLTTVVSYRAGYMVAGEIQTIPATPFQVTPMMPYGQWATDESVTNVATGELMTPMPPNTTPLLTGQYIPPNPSVGQAYYAFSASDTGVQVSLAYGYVPADLEEAVLEATAERSAYRSRPGIRSQSLAAQESISYGTDGSNSSSVGSGSGGFSSYVCGILSSYCNVLPPPMGGDV